MATLTQLSVPRRTYKTGQNFGPTTFNIQQGQVGMQIIFSNPSGWPTGDICTIDIDFSFDNGVTWVSCGGMTVNGDTQGVNDPFIGIINGATLKCTFPQTANSITQGRASASVIQTFTTAIQVNTF